MNKDQFAASTEIHIDHNQKISKSPSTSRQITKDPFDKLIDSDQLTYLPNLYLRSHKALEQLIKIRQDYPEQRILLPRPQTTWDNLLDQVKLTARIIKEEKKHKIAVNSHLCRQVRMQVQRANLRSEQQYHFHRLVNSHLSESIIEAFQQSGAEAIVEELKQQVKQQEKQIIVKKPQDDIFVQEREDYSYIPEENLLDDLLKDPIIEEKEEYIEKSTDNIEPISTYIEQKYRENYPIISKQPVSAILRKGVLKKINENVRKRLKIKEEEQEIAGRSLSSATVFLSSLLNNQWQSKATNFIDLNSKTEWLSSGDKHRKKKDEDSFDLRWSVQQIDKLEKRNDKQLIKKGLIDSNILGLYMSNEQDEYRKMFDKNIKADKSFPPTIKNIKEITLLHPTKYYNEFHDKDYQLFIMKYNKRNLFKEFIDQSHNIFPENYYHEDEIQSAETINVGKMFVNPPERVLNRVIYKVKGNSKVDISIKSDLTHSNLDTNRMIIMAFLVNKYLSIFGNNWQNITMLLMMHPIFSNYILNKQTVQQIYQLVDKHHYKHLQQINLWDKKILPFDYYGCQSYTTFDQVLHTPPNQPPYQHYSNISPPKSRKTIDVDISDYQSLLNQDLEDIQEGKQQLYTEIEQQFKVFTANLKEDAFKNNHQQNSLYNRISRTLTTFKSETEPIEYEINSDLYKEEEPSKIYQEIINYIKTGDVKSCFPIRKKKNINERNNQLVKILQALRSKNNVIPPLQKKTDQPTKGMGHSASAPKQPVVSSVAAASSQPSKAVEQPPEQKKSNLTKSPEKPSEKKLGAPSKKDKKSTKDGQDKK